MNINITKKQVRSYMKARHADYVRNSSGWWYVPGAGKGLSEAEIMAEAEAEIEGAVLGISTMPEWAENQA